MFNNDGLPAQLIELERRELDKYLENEDRYHRLGLKFLFLFRVT